MTALTHPSDVKKSNRSCSVKEKMPKFSGAASPSPSRGGTGVSVLVCTRGAAFEMDWRKFGVFQ